MPKSLKVPRNHRSDVAPDKFSSAMPNYWASSN